VVGPLVRIGTACRSDHGRTEADAHQGFWRWSKRRTFPKQKLAGGAKNRGPPSDIEQMRREEGSDSMATGTVKWFNGQKGFGFIAPDDGGNDIFVHISAVERAGLSGLAEGQKISYEVKVDPRRGKSSAENLRV